VYHFLNYWLIALWTFQENRIFFLFVLWIRWLTAARETVGVSSIGVSQSPNLRMLNPGFNPGFIPPFTYQRGEGWGVNPGLNPGLGVLRCWCAKNLNAVLYRKGGKLFVPFYILCPNPQSRKPRVSVPASPKDKIGLQLYKDSDTEFVLDSKWCGIFQKRCMF
jgi:hypothetical protein